MMKTMAASATFVYSSSMRLDIRGRIRNVNLPTSRPLMPLFEAVVNSIQAIEDVGREGTIFVRVLRDQNTALFLEDKSSRDIVGFEIEDNGIGFNEANYNAFSTSDTTYKASRGCKGVGRFVWLVAFNEVEIESTFATSERYEKRTFRFVPQGDGVEDNQISEAAEHKERTIVRLNGFKERFQTVAPKRLETIGAYLVEHCLEYLIRPQHPTLILTDSTSGESINLNDLFQKEMGQNASYIKFQAGGHSFELMHVRLYSSHLKDHLLHFCANNRVVKSEKLLGKIPNLGKALHDEAGNEFVYAAYLDGTILDETVNQERTDFSLSAEEGSLFEGPFTWSNLRSAANEQISNFLRPFTVSIQKQKRERLERFVATEGPMYRPILKHVENEIALIDPDIDDTELDLKLYKAVHSLQERLRQEGTSLIASTDAEAEFGTYASRFDDYFNKISDVNQSDLARYVFDRKLVLQFLQKLLSVQENGKYALEDKVHRLIFPMGETSNDVPFENHNLWLLDERLAYHRYLASDKQLRKTEPLNNDSKKELDIVVFDKACAFTDVTMGPFQTITIIEFKRPMRTSYSDDENPFEQVLNYIDDIRGGKALTPDKRPIPISEGVHFYCYIVADKTDLLEQYAYRTELERAPDGQGFFGYKRHYKAYIEFVSYSKLLDAAKQRNHAFFEKLGLPLAVRAAKEEVLVQA
jgi:hypothetical protein